MNQAQFDKQKEDIDNFISGNSRKLHNNGVTGSRKTTTTIRSIALDCTENPHHRWVIAVPLHKIIEGDDNLQGWCDKMGLRSAHIWGKNHFPLYGENKCYLRGCSKCADRDGCPYLNQDWNAQVLLCAYELIGSLKRFIGTYDVRFKTHVVNDWYGLIMEEEPTRYWMNEISLTNELSQHLFTVNETLIEGYWGKNTKYIFRDVTVNKFKPKTIDEKRLFDMGKYNVNLKYHTYNGIRTLFSHKPHIVPFYFRKVIFNCATTPANHRNMIFGDDRWVEIGIKEPISNPIISIGYHWGKQNTINRIESLKTFLSFFEANGKKILLITKQVIETDLGMNIDIVHYNSGRGFNNFNKPYDMIVVYGNFKLPPLERLKRAQLGVLEGTITILEDAEVLQSINRFRPYSHPDTPVILMTQPISDYYEESWTTVPDEVLNAYNDLPYLHEKNIDKVAFAKKYKKYTYIGYQAFVTWVRRWVFKTMSRNNQIILARLERKSIKQVATRVGVSQATVKRVFKAYVDQYGKSMDIFKKRLFEVED